jgi:hypothetical protein
MNGGQLYYWVNLAKGTAYRFRLSPDYYASLYIFSNTCSPATISSDCSSGGTTGDYLGYVRPNTTSSLIYTSSTGGLHRLAVDSYYASYSGKFKLEVETFKAAANSKCSGAQAVSFNSSGVATASGDTTGNTNEFGTQVNCGNLYRSLVGNQLYYKFNLTKGKTYTFTLSTGGAYLMFYLFGNTCDPSKINSACSSNGKTGLLSSMAYASRPATASFTPPSTGTYIVAVDAQYAATYPQYYGSFTLTVK